MTPDALKGKGAYRCGCGTRIKIEETAGTEKVCAASDCRLLAVGGNPVIPTCAEHGRRLMLWLTPEIYRVYPPRDWVKVSEKYAEQFGGLPKIAAWVTTPSDRLSEYERQGESHPRVVYFITFGDKVKIGTTTSIKRRIGSLQLPSDVDVVTTLGDHALERRLHSMFARERIGRSEWFNRSAKLDAYIQDLATPTTRTSRTPAT